jgi:beta-phosphoglucomutase-like phosphatase (HAD superfamily)
LRRAETAPQKKPDPQVYCQALDDLGFSAQDALAFEDSHNGLTAARRVGLDVIVTPAIYTSHEDHGDATDCLTDLTQFMRKYCDAT